MGPFASEFKQIAEASLVRLRAWSAAAWRRTARAFLRFTGAKASITRMRHQTLLLLRWLGIGGQLLAILFTRFVLDHEVPLYACLVPIVASAWLNLFLTFRYPSNHRLSDREAALYMGWDILQLATLLYFTGGLLNPFAILFLAPVTIAAGTLTRRSVIVLVLIGLTCVTVLALFGWHLDLPWKRGEPLPLPRRYEIGIWFAMVIGMLFSAIFAWRVSAESNRMSDALAATEMALAREQRLAAVGGLAAAAAHELGTPLATISVIARELEREAKASPYADDVALLLSQALRCRDILNRLTLEAQEGAAPQSPVGLRDLLEEVAEPHRAFGVAIKVDLKDQTPASGADQRTGPSVTRRPEIVHGLGNLVENAVDFARERVLVEAVVSPSSITVRVEDDGPGIAREVLDRLGEPFTTTRSRLAEAAEITEVDEHHGMGLGFFIAKTLLERTGARVSAANLAGTDEARGTPRGAVVTITWPRAALEAPTPPMVNKPVPARV